MCWLLYTFSKIGCRAQFVLIQPYFYHAVFQNEKSHKNTNIALQQKRLYGLCMMPKITVWVVSWNVPITSPKVLELNKSL